VNYFNEPPFDPISIPERISRRLSFVGLQYFRSFIQVGSRSSAKIQFSEMSEMKGKCFFIWTGKIAGVLIIRLSMQVAFLFKDIGKKNSRPSLKHEL